MTGDEAHRGSLGLRVDRGRFDALALSPDFLWTWASTHLEIPMYSAIVLAAFIAPSAAVLVRVFADNVCR